MTPDEANPDYTVALAGAHPIAAWAVIGISLGLLGWATITLIRSSRYNPPGIFFAASLLPFGVSCSAVFWASADFLHAHFRGLTTSGLYHPETSLLYQEASFRLAALGATVSCVLTILGLAGHFIYAMRHQRIA